MTFEEIKILNSGGIVPPTVIKLPTLPNSFCPPATNVHNEGIPQTPDPAKDFNGVPLSDLENLAETKNMDPLHRADAMAEQYKRGENLKALHKSLGKDKFKQIYSTVENK